MLFSFSRCSNFCPDFLGDIGERFDKKAKVNFKIFDVIDGTKKN